MMSKLEEAKEFFKSNGHKYDLSSWIGITKMLNDFHNSQLPNLDMKIDKDGKIMDVVSPCEIMCSVGCDDCEQKKAYEEYILRPSLQDLINCEIKNYEDDIRDDSFYVALQRIDDFNDNIEEFDFLSMKCNDKWEPLKEPETYNNESDEVLIGVSAEWVELERQKCLEYEQAKTYRERIEELEDKMEKIKSGDAWKTLCSEYKSQLGEIEQLTKERDELMLDNKELKEVIEIAKNDAIDSEKTKKQYREQLQAEKNKVKKLLDFVVAHARHSKG